MSFEASWSKQLIESVFASSVFREGISSDVFSPSKAKAIGDRKLVGVSALRQSLPPQVATVETHKKPLLKFF
jgi:hypothetical protein